MTVYKCGPFFKNKLHDIQIKAKILFTIDEVLLKFRILECSQLVSANIYKTSWPKNLTSRAEPSWKVSSSS